MKKKYKPFELTHEEKINFLSSGLTLTPKGEARLDYEDYLKREFPAYYNYNLHFMYGYFVYADKLQTKLTGEMFNANEKQEFIRLVESLLSFKIDYFYFNRFTRTISIFISIIKLYGKFIYEIITDSWWRRVWKKYLFKFIQTKFDKNERVCFWFIIYFICLPLKIKLITIKNVFSYNKKKIK